MESLELLTAISFVLGVSTASPQTYGEIGVTATNYEEQFSGDRLKSSPYAFRSIIGYQIHEKVSIEGLIGLGTGNAELTLNGTTIPGFKLEVDRILGLYVKGTAKITPGLDIFARAGIAELKGKLRAPGFSDTASESGFSYGFGASFPVAKGTSLQLDYMSYIDKNFAKGSGVTLGLGFNF